MYYIINENQQIIATDQHFLEHCNVIDITALNKAILLENILLDINIKTTGEKVLTLQNRDQISLFTVQTIRLSSLIGSLSLIVLSPIKREKAVPTTTEEIAIENLIINKQSNNMPHLITNIEKELFTQEPITNIENKNIVIDVVEISQKIGVSENDYQDFFNDYVSTALSLEKDLRNHADYTQSNAIETLLHLGDVLHLESLQNSILRIQNASIDETASEVSSFYEMLSRITLQKPTQKDNKAIDIDINNVQTLSKPPIYTEKSEKDIFELDLDTTPTQNNTILKSENKAKEDIFELDLDIPLMKPDEKQPLQAELNTSEELYIQKPNKISYEPLDLSKVQPIHFDFSLSAAAEELSLPENLIKEFMLDFISQVHTEIDTMLKAYQNTDLETIQKTGHLLKGVASNLRITTLSDTLYKIQFCTDLEDIEPLIKDFWGHFLSFETQMNSLSQ